MASRYNPIKPNGIVIPREDPIALAEAINLLIDNPSLRVEIGRNARKSMLQYSEKAMLEKLIAVYNLIIN